jgi:hypothetical protein
LSRVDQRECVTLKLKSQDHEVSTRQTTSGRAVRSAETLMRLAERLLGRPHPPKESVRLLGLSVSSLTGGEEGGEQLELDFDGEWGPEGKLSFRKAHACASTGPRRAESKSLK